mgnify:CR=1 FL=1
MLNHHTKRCRHVLTLTCSRNSKCLIMCRILVVHHRILSRKLRQHQKKFRREYRKECPLCLATWPNINGFLNSYGLGNVPNDFNIHWDGALTLVSLQEQSLVQINEDPQWKTTQDFRFDASKSNGTYSGNLVQPKALNALPCIRC